MPATRKPNDPRLPVGFLYRRKRQKYYPIDYGAGTIYWEWSADGDRQQTCLHTESERTAIRIVRQLHGRIDWTDEHRRLKSLVRIGEDARKKLEELTFGI